jgi:hypothetical protein
MKPGRDIGEGFGRMLPEREEHPGSEFTLRRGLVGEPNIVLDEEVVGLCEPADPEQPE